MMMTWRSQKQMTHLTGEGISLGVNIPLQLVG